MAYQIEILDVYDPSSYFIFGTARAENESEMESLGEINTHVSEDCFYIEEGNVECFLWYFLKKYFDNDLSYNQKRELFSDGFEWWGENYFTYESMELLLEEMDKKSSLLKNNYHDDKLSELKEWFSIFYMCDRNDEDYKNPKSDSIEKNIGVVIDFYQRFISKMRNIMKNHPEANLICVTGP